MTRDGSHDKIFINNITNMYKIPISIDVEPGHNYSVYVAAFKLHLSYDMEYSSAVCYKPPEKNLLVIISVIVTIIILTALIIYLYVRYRRLRYQCILMMEGQNLSIRTIHYTFELNFFHITRGMNSHMIKCIWKWNWKYWKRIQSL